MEQKSYDSVKRFEGDIKWYVHNCRSIALKWQPIKTASLGLIDCVKELIHTIRNCDECFVNLYEYFTIESITKACSKLHLPLWVKSERYEQYWPAKLLDANVAEKTVRVQFFGDYSCWSIMDTNLYLYSKDSPEKKGEPAQDYMQGRWRYVLFFNSNASICHSSDILIQLYYNCILQDADEYIAYIRSEFGFDYADPHTIFEPANFDGCLQQITAVPDSNHANKNAEKNQNSSQKRNLQDISIKARPVKQPRGHNDDWITQSIQMLHQAQNEMNSNKQASEQTIERLTDANNLLKRENTTLLEEKKELALKLCNARKKLEEEKNVRGQEKKNLMLKFAVEKIKHDAEQKNFAERYNALENAKNEEKKTLMNQVNAEKKKRKDEQDIFGERYNALGNAKNEEKKTLTYQVNALKLELTAAKKNHDDKLNALKEALQRSTSNLLEIL